MHQQFLARRYVVTAAVLVLAAIAPLLVSCGDDDKEPVGPGTTPFVYPHADGSEWVYTHDGDNYRKFVISGTFQHPAAGFTRKIWYYEPSSSSGWIKYGAWYLKVTANDVRLYQSDAAEAHSVLLEFPLAVGKQWDAGEVGTATVSSQEIVSVPAGSFMCYKIEYAVTGGVSVYWWPSNVGGFGAKTTFDGGGFVVELKSYNLPS